MNSFVTSALNNRSNRVLTENGAETFDSSSRPNVDLFFAVGALRGQNTDRLFRLFDAAFYDNREHAIRIMLWARDVRGGAGERQIFRDVLTHMEMTKRDDLIKIIPHIAEYGRWDDLLIFKTPEIKALAYGEIKAALAAGNGLAAKWMPRQGILAVELRKFLGLTPKQYRKTLVRLTNVVETQMCAKEWDKIDLEKVPSLATTRYTKAFAKHIPQEVKSFVEKVEKGEAKINVSAIYPYDIVNRMGTASPGGSEERLWTAQWDAMPDFVGENNALAIVDVSGSMHSPVGGNIKAIDVALSLGLYLSDKQKGPFKDLVLTFTDKPKFVKLTGSIYEKARQLNSAEWGMNTNVENAFLKILETAKSGDVRAEDMPKFLVIISDMEFDRCTRGTAFETARSLYQTYGYELPQVVFWNVTSRHDNVPVKFNETGVALVSGFSPAVFKSVVSGKGVDPEQMMLDVIGVERYNIFR